MEGLVVQWGPWVLGWHSPVDRTSGIVLLSRGVCGASEVLRRQRAPRYQY